MNREKEWGKRSSSELDSEKLPTKRPAGSRPPSPSSLFYKKYDIFNAWSNLISLSRMKTPVNERLWN